jgi:hypothetical protein
VRGEELVRGVHAVRLIGMSGESGPKFDGYQQGHWQVIGCSCSRSNGMWLVVLFSDLDNMQHNLVQRFFVFWFCIWEMYFLEF